MNNCDSFLQDDHILYYTFSSNFDFVISLCYNVILILILGIIRQGKSLNQENQQFYSQEKKSSTKMKIRK